MSTSPVSTRPRIPEKCPLSLKSQWSISLPIVAHLHSTPVNVLRVISVDYELVRNIARTNEHVDYLSIHM